MKPPSTVEARVAEELRNWLSSELEQLDASNTNQFAHHVVTILLHEDLDIEDEPLTTGDDFLHDIYSIRRGKTRDKQKKAAVQFLRSAVCCNDPGEAEIQGVVEELMVKIEETKIKMNSKSSPKRMSVDVHNSFNHSSVKAGSSDTERLYNEAFPSLHSNNSNNSSMEHRPGLTRTENSRSRQPVDHAHIFDSQEEAHACNTARRVFISALAESVLPSFEATEIVPSEWMDSSVWDDAYSCWSMQSAFQNCTLLKKFVPSTSPLKSGNQSDTRSRYLREFCPIVLPVINQSDLQSVHLHPNYEKTLTEHPQLFRPIKERSESLDTPQSETDVEVDRIVNCSQHQGQQNRKVRRKHQQTSAVSKAAHGNGRNVDLKTVPFVTLPFKEDTLTDNTTVSDSLLQKCKSRDENDTLVSDSLLQKFKGRAENDTLVSDSLLQKFKGRAENDTLVSDSLLQKFKGRAENDTAVSDSLLQKFKVRDETDTAVSDSLLQKFKVRDETDTAMSHSRLQKFKGRDEISKGIDFLQGESSLELEIVAQDDLFRTFSPEKSRDVPQHLWETSSEIDEVRSFPEHDGSFWKLVTDAGSMALYPVMPNQLVPDHEDRLDICHTGHVTSPCASYPSLSGQDARGENTATNHLETSMEHYFHCSVPDVASGQWMLESACIQVQYYYAVQQIARIQQEHNLHLQQASLHMPSCLSHEGSQFLQRAFVNSYFSDLFKEAVCYKTWDRMSGFRCSDLEHCWLSTERLTAGDLKHRHLQVVPGCTCSSWLENNCHLGDSCPFSHPSL